MSAKKVTMLQIDYFLAVAEHLSFTEAANELYTSQPSVSKQIAILESQIGTKLFFRTKRAVRLTAAGEVLYEELAGISQKISRAIGKATGASTDENNTLNIGIYSAIDTSSFLPEFLCKFRSEHDSIRLNFERQYFRSLREKLALGKFDVIITFDFDIPERDDIASKTIKLTEGCIFVPQSDPLAARDALTIADLKDADFVCVSRSESPGGFNKLIRHCERNGFTPRIVQEVPNHESLMLAVQAGAGVTIADREGEIHERDGIRYFPQDDDFVGIKAAWRRDNRKPVLCVFIDELAIYLSEQDKDWL
jgi:DNA-binding transcriptional LysR family regulator